MATGYVRFNAVQQVSQNTGGNDPHMISRIFFDFKLGDKVFTGLHVDIKQPVGSDYEQTKLEVSKPVGYDGAFNFAAFSQGAEDYYRSQFGSQGSMISIGGGANVHMEGNISIGGGGQLSVISFEVSESNNTW